MTPTLDEYPVLETDLRTDDLEFAEIQESVEDGWLWQHRFGLTIFCLLVLFSLFVFWGRIVVTVRAGQAGVLFSRFSGTNLERVYLEGVHLVWPWDHLQIYDLRIQMVDHSAEILSTDGLDIKIDFSVRFSPVGKTLPYLHQKIGPEYVNKIVLPEVVTAVREVMGKYTPQQLYTTNSDETQRQIIRLAGERVRDRYIELDNILIRRITLPPLVEAGIQKKLIEQQEDEEYRYRLAKEKKESDRKREEAAGIRDWETIANATYGDLLRTKGIAATLELAKSSNAKIIVVGAKDGLPLIFNAP